MLILNAMAQKPVKSFSSEKMPRRSRTKAFCSLCKAQVELMTFSQAAHFCFSDPDTIIELAEKGKFHRIHNRKGEVMICRNSLEIVRKKFSIHKTIILKPI